MPVAAGIGIGSLVYSIWKAHHDEKAVKEATAQQQAAGDKGIARQDQAVAQARQDTGPYRALGAGAANLLGQGLGIDIGAFDAMGGVTPGPTNPLDVPGAKKAAALKAIDDNNGKPWGVLPAVARAIGMGDAPSAPAALRQSSYGLPSGLGVNNEAPMQVLAPDGTPGTIPAGRWREAQSMGFRLAGGG